MKKYLAILISAVLLISMIAALGTSAADPITVTHGLEDVEAMVGSLTKSDTGSVAIEGKSLKINTQRADYGLNGDPANTEQYKTTYNYARRTKLTAFADGMTIPAGTYTVSIWVYENGSHLGDQTDHKCEIAFTLHSEETTDDTLGYNHADLDMITLFNATEGSRAGTPENAFAKSGVTQKVGTRTWAEYTAEITVDETVSQFAFWLLGDESDEGGEGGTYSTWIENLSVYNEEGTPETTTTEATTTAATTTAAKTTAKTTVTTTVAEAVEDTTAEGESTGCKGSVGAGFAAIAVSGLTASAVIFRKKKED